MSRRLAICVLMLATLLTAPGASADTLEEGAQLAKIADGLDMPVDLAFGPDGSLYYAELGGSLRRIAPGASAPDPEPLWTPQNLQTGGERGFVGLALDPDFPETGAFYVFYVVNESGRIHNRLSMVVDGEETVLLDGLFSNIMHNSGRIAFMPDKTMLVSTGDAVLDTAGPHRAVHAHDETNLSGKVLRLERDGSPAAGNPWGNEVWTKGHRNVYGIAVSPDGVVIGTENGPEKGDEVNLLEPGNDYGWPTCKGACGPEHADAGFTDAILEYSPTIAPTGATWYRGYFYFSDFNAGRIHRIYELPDGSWADDRVIRLDQPRILDVEAGPDGLYFATWSEIYRVTVGEAWLDSEPPTTWDGGDGDDGGSGTGDGTGDGGDGAVIGGGADGGTTGNGGNTGGGADVEQGAQGIPAPGAAFLLVTLVALARVTRRAVRP